LPLQTSELAQMVQAQVPVPSGWMDASLTRRIHILLSRAALNVLVWACGQISYQSGWAHTKGGVTKHMYLKS